MIGMGEDEGRSAKSAPCQMPNDYLDPGFLRDLFFNFMPCEKLD
jgi:hypothetical protein